MPSRWMDEDDRRRGEWRSEEYGRGEGRSPEGRSFDDRYDTGSRFAGRDRDRVFGERETGAEYNRSSVRPGGGGYGAGGSYGGGESYGRHAGDWSEGRRGRRAGGMRFERQDYTRGGRFYGDDGRTPIYRSEYGQGGRDHGEAPRGYDADRMSRSRYDNAEIEQRYSRDMERPASGGTGGYDFERGYGDGGRGTRSGGPAWQDRDYSGASPAFYRQGYGGERDFGRHDRSERFEDRAYQAGQGLRRIGERVSAFLGGMDRRDGAPERHDDGPRRYASDFGREERWVDHSGRGPKNYARADDRIRDEACQALTDDPWLDASQIDVNVSAGEVTLGGFVDNREAKRRAERLVEDLPGVSNVQNDLRVGGNGLTGSGRGFGDSALEAQMRGQAGDGSAMSRNPNRRS